MKEMNIVIHFNKSFAMDYLNRFTTDAYLKAVRVILDQAKLSREDKIQMLNQLIDKRHE